MGETLSFVDHTLIIISVIEYAHFWFKKRKGQEVSQRDGFFGIYYTRTAISWQ